MNKQYNKLQPGEIIYRIERAAKNYQNRRVLEVDQLEIRNGEIFALVGPSGSGKSTLLRLMNFLEAPDQGSIYFHNQEINATKEAPLNLRRKVTMVFQRPMLLNRTVQANVRFGLELRGQNNTNGLIQSTLQEVGLAELANQKARTLSGGEAQRVALARAMVLRPEVLLLDEPTANLDPYNVGMIERTVKNLNRDYGMTLVLVTHNVFQAKRLAHRVGFLMDGKVIEVAPTDSFFNQPSDPRTAAFVRGDMVY
jgi:tungstate transport system ATP-binding protein